MTESGPQINDIRALREALMEDVIETPVLRAWAA